MHHELQVFRFIVLAVFLGAVSLAFYSACMAFIAHSHGRDLATQVVLLFLTGFFVILAALPAWIAYLVSFRFLTGIEISGCGYALQTRALLQQHATQISAVRKIGGIEGQNELTVVRANCRYWVCLSATLAELTAVRKDGF